MAKKRALGRGLSNLLPGTADGRPIVRENANYQEIPLNDIKPNPNQPRKRFAEKEIEELARTLKTVGLIEPVVVRKQDDGFQLISGERRWRAARIAGFKKIPAVLKQVNDLQALEMGIIENIQREELNPVEEARAYSYWMEQTGQKASDLANKVGKDRTTITNLVRLLKLPEPLLARVESGEITPGQARPLLGVADQRALERLGQKIIREGWTARRVEDEVARATEGQTGTRSSGPRKARKDPNVSQLETRLRARLTARVSLQHKKDGSGKIMIHYANLDDLDRIVDMIKARK